MIIFSTAAICNQCGITPSTTTEKVGVESTAAAGTTETISETTASASETTAASTSAENETASSQEQQQVMYKNTQYGFNFSLPISWEGYNIILSNWEGFITSPQGNVTVEQGPIISIRHPKWTSANPRQDIPIMVFTLVQWDALQQGKILCWCRA